MAASKEISVSRITFDVFLSFRGKDTRKHFTDHLYSALIRAGFHTFRDDDELDIGEKIDAGLQKAIRESRISIVVFSKDYASSTWCLDELVLILKRTRDGSHTLLPIFYDVLPSQVRKQTGTFASSFRKHEEQFNKEIYKINQWKAALKDAVNLAGMELKDRYESHFIQDVVREISKKLHPGKLDLTPHLVGTNLIVDKINFWLRDEAHEASMAIIHGQAGVGKTTTAKIIYNENLDRFESCSFLSNVRDLSRDPNSSIRLQEQLLSDLFKGKIHEVHSTDVGIVKIQGAIRFKKVLLIFNGVDESDQLEVFLGKQKVQLFPGSKVIITTMNEHLLRVNQVHEKFQIKELNVKEAIQLFKWHAFGQNHPINRDYWEYSMAAVEWCGGLPLALEVLGSSLFGRSIDVWEDTIKALKIFLDSKLQRLLRISYDSLQNDHDQNLFLNIACFFVGMEKDYVTEILKGCDFLTSVGIHNLVDRCLLSVDEHNMLRMNQLLREMGREIVRQESTKHPEKRSRLWKRRDACTVLQAGVGTEKIMSLVFSLHKLVASSYTCTQQPTSVNASNSFSLSRRINVPAQSFAKMHKLQILQLDGVNVKGDYGDLPKNLVLLCWQGFPLRCIPSNFHLEKLVSLDLSYSDIESVWDRIMVLPKLKFLNVSHCRKLTRVPNFCKIPCVERLIFKGCIKIFEVDESIECLKRLLILNLKDCRSLRELPKNLTMLKSLEEIDLSGCSSLAELPEDLWKLTRLKVFNASGVIINQFLSTTTSKKSRTFKLRHTNLSFTSLPRSLVHLTLKDCNLCEETFPSDLSMLRSLKRLNISGNPFRSLPESVSSHTGLNGLAVMHCTKIKSLSNLPINLVNLAANNCSSLERIDTSHISRLSGSYVFVDYCDKLVEIQGTFKMYSIGHIDNEILKSMGLSNLESLANIKMDMFNRLNLTRKTTFIQVFDECGKIPLPENDVPDCFSLQCERRSILFGFNNMLLMT